jgi:hypothetical protein
MSKILTSIVALLIFQAHLFAQSSDVEILANTEKQRSEAIASHNMQFLQDLYVDDFYGVTAIGFKVDKKKLIGIFEGFKASDTRTGPEEVTVKVNGTSATVSGQLVTRNAAGEIASRSLFMHFYVKSNNRWQIVGGQGAPYPN